MACYYYLLNIESFECLSTIKEVPKPECLCAGEAPPAHFTGFYGAATTIDGNARSALKILLKRVI